METKNKRLIGRHILLFSIVVLTVFSSCVTQKKKGDVSALKRAFHNMNAHYNGYYNANVLIDESIAKLNDAHQDNFNQILDVYPFADVSDAKSVQPDLDEAIKKSSIVITLHRPSKWVDDSYFDIAQAQYLKKDYESAEETLLYLEAEFNPIAMAKKKAKRKKRKKKHKKRRSKPKKKKKSKKKKKKSSKKKKKKKKLTKKEMRERYLAKKRAKELEEKTKNESDKPDEGIVDKPAEQKIEKKKSSFVDDDTKVEKYGLFKHRPAYQQGQLLLAQNYTQRKMYEDASYILRRLEQNPATFKKMRPEIAKAKADLLLKQKKYKEAIPALEEAVSLFKKKKQKVRLLYILGQLYQKNSQEKEAYEAFAKVVKYKPSYEMTFSAKMNVALNSWLSGNSTADDAIASLEKMLKDRKNEDYKDQLYFTLAKLYKKQGQEDKMIAALEKSLENNSGNQAQIVESSLMLADLYFAKANFISAKQYYDRALMAMDKSDEEYDRVAKYSENLTGIAANLKIIEEQDSLLKVVAMPEAEQRALAVKLIEEKMLKQAQAQAEAAAKAANSAGRRPSGTIPGMGVKSTFFAYDANKVKKGKRNFEKRWGDRPLRDNWRRSASQDVADIENTEGSSHELGGYSDQDIADILKALPNSPEAKSQAQSKIYQAMFDLGVLYRDRLEESKRSVAVLEDMEQRFADSTRNQLDGWYYLYLGSGDLNLPTKERKYHDLIVKNYPNSNYAQVLKNPNYLDELQKDKNKVADYFDQTYILYEKKQYKVANERIAKASQLFGADNPLEAKFSLLSAMLGGALKGRKTYIDGLKKVIAKYKNTDEERRAKEILRVLGEATNTGVGSVGKASKETKALYKYEEKKMHFILILLDADKVVVKDVKRAISDFDKKFFKLQHFRISNIFLGSNVKSPIIVIRKFRNKAKAMAYYQTIVGDNNVRAVIKDAKVFPVSQGNYRRILRQKNLVGYEEFFHKNYK